MMVKVCIGKVLKFLMVGGVVVKWVFWVGSWLSWVRCLMMWMFVVRSLLCVGCLLFDLVLLMLSELMLMRVIFCCISLLILVVFRKGVFVV